MGVIRWEQNVKNKKGHSVTGGLKMGVNVAAHTRHIFLGSAPPRKMTPLVVNVDPLFDYIEPLYKEKEIAPRFVLF